MTQTDKTPEELRRFGQVMAAAFALISLIPLYHARWTALVLLGLSATFLLAGLFSPLSLKTIERLWMRFGERMSVVMTFLILSLTYFLAITPLAFFLRLIGKDLLSVKLDRNQQSYWRDVPADGPGSRFTKPF